MKTIEDQAVQPTAERVVLLAPPGGNTGPLPPAVQAALAKATHPERPPHRLDGTAATPHELDAAPVPAPVEDKVVGDAADMTAAEARDVTDQIRAHLEATSDLIVEAYTRRAWFALGHGSWDEYCDKEFGTTRLRLPREERADVVRSLRASGLSIRAITAATGDSYGTVHRELSGDPNGSPDDESLTPDLELPATVTGRDGKNHAARRREVPKRDAFSNRFYHALSGLQDNALKLENLMNGKGFAEHADRVCSEHREYIIWAHETITRLLVGQMHTNQAELRMIKSAGVDTLGELSTGGAGDVP
jgi:hypothetical protein